MTEIERDIKKFLADVAARADEDDATERPLYRSRNKPKHPSQVYSLRMPVERIEELRLTAKQRGVSPTVLMRTWVLEKLDQVVKQPKEPRVDMEFTVWVGRVDDLLSAGKRAETRAQLTRVA